ncbi:MAG: hypothetical protein ACYS67_07705, partial [Planctomycetota bacterium]
MTDIIQVKNNPGVDVDRHRRKRMRILVENGSYNMRNQGDIAMLQVAVGRLHKLWPSALIEVPTK